MGNIVNNFCKTFGIDENQSRKRDDHHQLTGLKNARIETNWTKLSHVFSNTMLHLRDKIASTISSQRRFFQRMWQTVFYRPKKLGRQSMNNLSKKNLKEKDLRT